MSDPAAADLQFEQAVRKHKLVASYRLFARFGFDEGAAGHITVRDPLDRNTFWVAPFGRWFGGVTVADLVRVDQYGDVVEGSGPVNKAAFFIHSAIHDARPEVDGAAHAHALHAKTFAALDRTLRPLTQDSCAFYGRHSRFEEFSGVVLDRGYGDRIAKTMGEDRALILANHGHLTAATSLDAAVWWFISMERCFQSELLVLATGEASPIPHEEAALTASQHTVEYAELCFSALYERIMAEQPDLAASRPV
ncbi:class II aldolase/adducin family protein [Nakamurella sp. YIM 132087]|uniref:Class II aldolase/adducin family protein n=1 Tax=Nakamurella alba TaxID=2665158 RepID=A0A7K1FIW6_9ACTN|nr:class II aldolase/adducin family protein [Nakamurella alba]